MLGSGNPKAMPRFKANQTASNMPFDLLFVDRGDRGTVSSQRH
jgi:hypothetical protein